MRFLGQQVGTAIQSSQFEASGPRHKWQGVQKIVAKLPSIFLDSEPPLGPSKKMWMFMEKAEIQIYPEIILVRSTNDESNEN